MLRQIGLVAWICFRGYRTLYSVVFASGLVAALVVGVSGGPMWAAFGAMAVAAMFALLHWLLLLVHESGHLVALRLLGLPVESMRAARNKVIINYRGGTMARNGLVSLAGPVVAFSAGAAITAGLIYAFPSWSSFLRVRGFPWPIELAIPAIVGFEHLLGLGPWAPDGKVLWARTAAK